MKIQCDVCEKEEASVYCTADEASLCGGCDRRVHHANKLANKHPRFSLLTPSSKDAPRCDICQERRAFVFCKEDRAILCRECDAPIHRTNEHTQKHIRFLLTGVKLSGSASCYENSSNNQPPSSSNSNGSNEIDSVISKDQSFRAPNHCYGINQEEEEGASMEASNISEYLMETLPGWQVDEFLDPTSSHPYGFCKAYNSTMPFMQFGPDDNGKMGTFWSEDLGLLVQSPSPSPPLSMDHIANSRTSLSKGFLNGAEEVNSVNKINEEQQTVPLFNPSSIKRSRQQW